MGGIAIVISFLLCLLFFGDYSLKQIVLWASALVLGAIGALDDKLDLGYGFMRIAEGDYFESVHTYAARMTHNTFVQVLLNLGILGFTITTFQMIATICIYMRSRSAYLKVFFIAIFIPIFINSLTEFGIFGENNFGILFYQFLIIAPIIHYSIKMSDSAQLYRLRLQY